MRALHFFSMKTSFQLGRDFNAEALKVQRGWGVDYWIVGLLSGAAEMRLCRCPEPLLACVSIWKNMGLCGTLLRV